MTGSVACAKSESGVPKVWSDMAISMETSTAKHLLLAHLKEPQCSKLIHLAFQLAATGDLLVPEGFSVGTHTNSIVETDPISVTLKVKEWASLYRNLSLATPGSVSMGARD